MTGLQPTGAPRIDWLMPLDQPVAALPAVLVGPAIEPKARRQALAAAASCVLAMAPEQVQIAHDMTGAPIVIVGSLAADGLAGDGLAADGPAAGDHALADPASAAAAGGGEGAPRGAWRLSGLNVSSASRGPAAALALAAEPVGVDIETVSLAADIPWNVLHPRERATLADLPEAARGEAFLRIWTVKEAYLKALRLGLAREPSSFAVVIDGEEVSAIVDTDGTGTKAHAETRRLEVAGTAVIVSAVLLLPA